MQALLLPWRDDGRCGGGFTAPDGTLPAQCNPWDEDGRTCCSASGRCIHAAGDAAAARTITDGGATCADGTEYHIRTIWRLDGRCGADVRDADGRMSAQCHPFHPGNLTCCSEEGWCGAWPSYAHCRCKDCINHYSVCSCGGDLRAPCQDPASRRCYPRTQPQDKPDFKLLALAPKLDRRPDQDPRRSMRDQAIDERFREPGHARKPKVPQGTGMNYDEKALRPVVDGMRCAVGLVDCAPHGHSLSTEDSSAEGTEESAAAHGEATGSGAAALIEGSAVPSRGMPPTPPQPAARSKSSPPPTAPPLPIRLAGGQRPREGRVELLFNDTWGSICGKGWGWTAAHVACRSLGYGGVLAISASSVYGGGYGPILMSHVDCNGNEAGLERCQYYGLGISHVPPACERHTFDVGVQCSQQRIAVPEREMLDKDDESPGPAPSLRLRRTSDNASSSPQCSGGETGRPVEIGDLGSALDALEDVVDELARRRLIVDDASVNRLTRLRLRLRRLAGKASTDASCSCEQCYKQQQPPVGGSPGMSKSTVDGQTSPTTEMGGANEADVGGTGEADVPDGLAARLPPDMLKELRQMPRKQDNKPLEESKREFEERQREENFDPLENDPAEQASRRRHENYVAPGTQTPPLREMKPHERLRKPPIQMVTNRKPPDWKTAYDARYQHTMEQVRLGLAPKGILRQFGPGPWDSDPSFWGGGENKDIVLEHEMDEDITFDT